MAVSERHDHEQALRMLLAAITRDSFSGGARCWISANKGTMKKAAEEAIRPGRTATRQVAGLREEGASPAAARRGGRRAARSTGRRRTGSCRSRRTAPGRSPPCAGQPFAQQRAQADADREQRQGSVYHAGVAAQHLLGVDRQLRDDTSSRRTRTSSHPGTDSSTARLPAATGQIAPGFAERVPVDLEVGRGPACQRHRQRGSPTDPASANATTATRHRPAPANAVHQAGRRAGCRAGW
jgi:hypothetical protein